MDLLNVSSEYLLLVNNDSDLSSDDDSSFWVDNLHLSSHDS